MKVKPYSKYKPSGVEWLGDVPSHWTIAPFKWEIARNDGGVWGEDPYGDEGCIVLRSTEQTADGHWQINDPARRILSDAERTTALLVEGDLLITKSSGSSYHIGKTTLVDAEVASLGACYSNFMQRVRTRPTFLPRLAWYVMNNRLARLQFDLLSNSTTGLANLNGTMVGQLLVTTPPFSEQNAIAAFLDRETSKIDTLITKQEKLIELLQEKRQAVISHAVTKGLDPTVPMKPSGVEWLGDVPVHWKITRLQWITSEINDINHEMPAAVVEGVPFLSAKDLLNDGTLNFDNDVKKISEDDFYRLSAKILPRRDDIIYSRIGARLGKARLVETDVQFLVSYSCCVIRLKNESATIPQYICSLLDTDLMLTEAKARTNGIGVPDLGLGEIGRYPIPMPPSVEQRAILTYLERQCRRIDILISKAKQAVELQTEHRTALISAAVTGKIDVRELVDREVVEEKAA